jgi:hypothetical protein
MRCSWRTSPTLAGTPAWNSKADSAIESIVQDFDEYIDISPFVGNLKVGTNVLAIDGMNSGSTSSDFLISVAMDAVLVKVENRSSLENELNLLDGLRITELMYHAQQGNNLDYVELKNVADKVLDLKGVRLSGGMDFTFPATVLQPGAYAVIVANLAAFQSTYGTTAGLVVLQRVFIKNKVSEKGGGKQNPSDVRSANTAKEGAIRAGRSATRSATAARLWATVGLRLRLGRHPKSLFDKHKAFIHKYLQRPQTDWKSVCRWFNSSPAHHRKSWADNHLSLPAFLVGPSKTPILARSSSEARQ